MKILTIILSIGILLSVSACTGSDMYMQEQISAGDGQLLETKKWEEADLSPEWNVLAISLFSEANANRIITARFDVDKKSGQPVMQFRVGEEGAKEDTRPILKTREENNRKWIYWGEVCGIMSAKRFADFLQKKFAGVPYETRFEPIEGEDCRKAYYREG